MTRGRSTPARAVAEIVRLYRDEGLTVSAVHAKTGVSVTVFRRTISNAGVARPRGERGDASQREVVLKGWCDGMAPGQAAVAAGLGTRAVRRIVVVGMPVPRGTVTAAQAAATLGVAPEVMGKLARAGLVRTWRRGPRGMRWYFAEDVSTLAAQQTRLAGLPSVPGAWRQP